MTKVLNQLVTERFAAYHGDCVEVMRGLPEKSVDYCIFSPPFASLYTYSNSPHDMGNVKNDDEFFRHFGYAVDELARVMKQGRNVSFHCMLMPTSKERDGYIGLRDFRGDLIREFQKRGFIFHAEVVIWKDPVTAMQRTKALGLLHKTVRENAAMSRMGIPDYLVTMRAPGEAPDRVKHDPKDYPVSRWQQIASPVWMDINPSDTLQHRSARENDDERHICIARGSLVFTRAGFKAIETVAVGDEVLTHKGRWRPVTATRCNGVRPVIRVDAHGVPGLRCTPDHKLWTRRATTTHPRAAAMRAEATWVEARETLASYVNLRVPPVEVSALSAQDWWIVGRCLGDGHMTKRGAPFISFDGDERESLLGHMGDRAGAINKTTTAFQVYVKGSGGKGGHHNDPLHAMIRRCGTGASVKQLPMEALTLDAALAEALLDGYLSADGHLDQLGRWHASSVSRALALGMAMVAQRARNCVASVFAGRKAGTCVIQGRKVNTMDEWKVMISPRNGSGFIAEDGAWKKVRSVALDGVAEVWDLQVEEDESFIVEGCVVHNCPLQLEVIRRGIELWTNPGDVVLSPFGGIGSESVVALELGRKAVTAELKASYYKQLINNLKTTVDTRDRSLFGNVP